MREVIITHHARERLMERFGIRLTEDEEHALLAEVGIVTQADPVGTELELVIRTPQGKVGAVAYVYEKVVKVITMYSFRRTGARKFEKKVLGKSRNPRTVWRKGSRHDGI